MINLELAKRLLEQQVCSLELAKRLKELGVPQESLFWWRTTKNDPSDALILDMRDAHSRYFDYVSALTVADFGEIFPERIEEDNLRFGMHKMYPGWQVGYLTGNDIMKYCEWKNTLADACATLLINLLENKIIIL